MPRRFFQREKMIEVDYRHFGFLKAKQIFFGDYLPSCEGDDFIYFAPLLSEKSIS
jgi:hypothetical protein